MPRYRVDLSYDGSDFSGWQIQPGAPSIQETLRDVLRQVLQEEEVYPVGAGRTDAGVHAHQQVAHFDCESERDAHKLFLSLNGLLPASIRATSVQEVSDDFHARYSAKGKEYHYHICTAPIVSPFQRLYSVHLRHRLDIEKMKEATHHFLGEHDFTSFANVRRANDNKAPNPVRTLDRLDLIETENGLRLEFEGPGFLYKMVRNITGCLIEIARGKREIKEIEELFAAKDRRAMGVAAPARGLFLVRVKY